VSRACVARLPCEIDSPLCCCMIGMKLKSVLYSQVVSTHVESMYMHIHVYMYVAYAHHPE